MRTFENSDETLPDINNSGSESSIQLVSNKEATNLNGLWSNSSR